MSELAKKVAAALQAAMPTHLANWASEHDLEQLAQAAIDVIDKRDWSAYFSERLRSRRLPADAIGDVVSGNAGALYGGDPAYGASRPMVPDCQSYHARNLNGSCTNCGRPKEIHT